MDKNDIDEFGRCVTEFGESVAAFGAIQAVVTKRTAWLVCNIEREKKGESVVYRQADFDTLSIQIQGIVKELE